MRFIDNHPTAYFCIGTILATTTASFLLGGDCLTSSADVFSSGNIAYLVILAVLSMLMIFWIYLGEQ